MTKKATKIRQKPTKKPDESPKPGTKAGDEEQIITIKEGDKGR